MTAPIAWQYFAKQMELNGYTPHIWLGDDSHLKFAKETFPDSVFSLEDLRSNYNHLLTQKWACKDVDFLFSKDFLRTKDCAIKMMDRLDRIGQFTRIDREAVFLATCVWHLEKLENGCVEFALFCEAPHSFVQYILFEICKFKKIPCYKFKSWPNKPILFLKSFDDPDCVYPSHSRLESKIWRECIGYYENIANRKVGIQEPDYMIKQKENSRSMRRFQKYALRVRSILTQKKNAKFHDPTNPNSLGILKQYQIRKIKRTLLKRSAEKDQVDHKQYLNDQYVYFPLHYEPERTTNPDGELFHDQFIALCFLRKILAPEVKILVKEHPSQFSPAMKGLLGRSSIFYENVRNVQNTHFVKPDTDSTDLIAGSNLVATITGTVGIEAALMEKRCLVFGDAWYNGCPNTLKVTTDTTMYDINKMAKKPSKDVLSFLEELLSYSILGFHNSSFEKLHPEYVDDKILIEQGINAARLMIEALEKKK